MMKTMYNRGITGGIVKKVICVIAMWFAFIILGVSSARSQTQEVEGYTIIRGGTGSIVCLGRWVPPAEVGKPGVCEGQLADVSQLTAISTKRSADRLDQLLQVLDSIDQKLTENNVQIERLIEATVRTQAAIDQQVGQVGELMHNTISSRVDALSRRVLANDTFKKELEKLKEDILSDVRRHYPGQ
jgi:hypothetical protein